MRLRRLALALVLAAPGVAGGQALASGTPAPCRAGFQDQAWVPPYTGLPVHHTEHDLHPGAGVQKMVLGEVVDVADQYGRIAIAGRALEPRCERRFGYADWSGSTVMARHVGTSTLTYTDGAGQSQRIVVRVSALHLGRDVASCEHRAARAAFRVTVTARPLVVGPSRVTTVCGDGCLGPPGDHGAAHGPRGGTGLGRGAHAQRHTAFLDV